MGNKSSTEMTEKFLPAVQAVINAEVRKAEVQSQELSALVAEYAAANGIDVVVAIRMPGYYVPAADLAEMRTSVYGGVPE